VLNQLTGRAPPPLLLLLRHSLPPLLVNLLPVSVSAHYYSAVVLT
jgi:hypothetical protein